MEIYNLYSLDIFFQGLFLLACVSLGVYLVFKDNLEIFKNIENINEFSHSLNDLFNKTIGIFSFNIGKVDKNLSYKYFGLIPLIIVASFIIGILGNGLADSWIDSSSNNHLKLKALWGGKLISCNDTTENHLKSKILSSKLASNKNNCILKKNKVLKYKDGIRKQSFEKVFGVDTDTINKRIYRQLYYQSKNELISQKHYYNYIRKSQAMSEYSRTFALGFFFLMVCGFLNLLLMIVRVFFSTKITETETETETQNEIETKKNKKRSKFQFKKVINVSNSVILIFSLFSILIISFFLSPKFCSYENFSWDYLQVLVLVYFGCFTFLLFIFKKFRRLKFSFFIYSIIYVISFVGYFVSAKIWIASEEKVASKVYGIYKTKHTTSSIEEIKFAKEKLFLDVELNTSKKEKDNH